MSWHLQTLAKYGYVEEAKAVSDDAGRGASFGGHVLDEDPDDTELSVAATGLTKLGNERAFDRLDRWMNERGSYPREWQHAWFSQNNISYLMPDELGQLGEDLLEVILRYRDRTVHPSCARRARYR